jgi:hypothetical protein
MEALWHCSKARCTGVVSSGNRSIKNANTDFTDDADIDYANSTDNPRKFSTAFYPRSR